MNSLSYLSRQFDSIASPTRAPPSTPTAGTEETEDVDRGTLTRVKTWSTTFLFPNPSTRSPKRTLSSPQLSGKRSEQRPSIRPRHVETAFRRTLLVRAALLMWNALHAIWVSLPGREKQQLVEAQAQADAIQKRTVSEEIEPEKTIPEVVVDEESQRRSPLFTYPQQQHPPPSRPPSLAGITILQEEEPSSSFVSRTRSPTPVLSTRKPGFRLLPKTLVLDLDETLIHSTSRPIFTSGAGGSGLLGLGSAFGRRNKGAGHMVEVVLGGRSTLYHVYKRPYVDFFLRTVAGWYTVVIFTASMQEYADPVIDWLDAGRGILARRFFRDSCTQLPNGSYTKDLTVIEPDLSRVCLVDNSPISYRINEANGIPIEGWTHDPSDEGLLDLLPVLDSLRFTNDVRSVLGIRGFSS